MNGIRVPYRDDGHSLEGYLVAQAPAQALPGVLVVPTWLNVNESICRRAERIADLGYAVFVADIFGAGVRPAPPQSPMAIVAPYLSDRLLFRRRLLAALDAFQSRPECDRHRVAAVGYCLGGCGVLELVRAGAPLKGVVCLHGMLNAPVPARPRAIQAKILVLHGDADPHSPFAELAAFREEMLSAEANWEIDLYGDARHSFTGEGISGNHGPEAAQHPQSDSRSWRATREFLAEVLN